MEELNSTWDSRRTLMSALGQGAKVANYIVTDESTVLLQLMDGRELALTLDAGCCSGSYFNDTKQFEELVGRTIVEAEERDGESPDGGDTKPHFLVFKTDRSHVTIDWRNESNGYYDGTVIWDVR